MIRVKKDDMEIELNLNTWEWHAVNGGEAEELLAKLATLEGIKYQYSTADGQPGALLAYIVAKRYNGQSSMPEVKQSNEEVVY